MDDAFLFTHLFLARNKCTPSYSKPTSKKEITVNHLTNAKRITWSLFFITCVALAAWTQTPNIGDHEMSSQNKQSIETLLRSYESSLNASDVDAVLKLYAKDGVFMPQHSPSLVGADAIRGAYTHVFEAITLAITFDILEVEVLGDGWAFARTTSAGTTTINATGDQLAEGNQELFLLRRQSDGEWKIARYIFSTTNPRSG